MYGYPSDTFVKLPVSKINNFKLLELVYKLENNNVCLDPQAWEKGVVFINGMNLGRYWSIGPQQTLYLPGPFLNSGINQVQIVSDLNLIILIL